MDKVAVIDRHADAVKSDLLDALELAWDEILAVARGRHILGSYEYGDANLFEWSDGKVSAAVMEELADAVVYTAWLREREVRRACS